MKSKPKPVKDKLKTIKKFLSGESVWEDVLSGNIEQIAAGWVFKVISDTEDKPSWYDDVNTFYWHEQKTYPDSQFPDVRMVDLENASVALPDAPNFNDHSKPMEENINTQKTLSTEQINSDWLKAQALQERLRQYREDWIWNDANFNSFRQ